MRRAIGLRGGVFILMLLLLLSVYPNAPRSAAAQSPSAVGYSVLQLTSTKHDNCFLPEPESGNPLFGDPRTWQDGTAWAACSALYGSGSSAPTGFPGNYTYSVLNSSSGLPATFTLTSANDGWPSGAAPQCLSPQTGEYMDCLWYYRGQIVTPYSDPDSDGNLTGVWGYNTAGSNTQSGNVNNVLLPTGDMFLAGCTTGQAAIVFPAAVINGGVWNACTLSLTYPSLSGSSAAVAIAYNLTIPAQTLQDGTDIPAQYTVLLMQYSNGEWTPFTPSNGAPDPNQYSIVTVGNGENSYKCVVQTVAPVDVISSGYGAFAYATQSFDYDPTTGNLCVGNFFDNGPISLYVASLTVPGNAQLLQSFYPPVGPTIDNGPICGGTTNSSPCFTGLTAMWGDLILYQAGPSGNPFLYYLIDALHPTNSLEPLLIGPNPPGNVGQPYQNFFGKPTDGSSMMWYQGTNLTLWNGKLGTREIVANYPGETWVDNDWAAWATQTGSAINFYDLSNTTEAYLLNPHIYTVQTPDLYTFLGGNGEMALPVANALEDMASGQAYWISDNVTSSGANDFTLSWYNATQAKQGIATGGNISLSWAKDIADMVVTNDWVYLSALANGGKNFQIYAIQIPSRLVALESGGQGTAEFLLSGNVSSSQVLSATYQPSPQGLVQSLDLTVTGTSGTAGNITIQMPKSSVPQGAIPTVLINGVRASVQSYTEDALNYYVTFLLHFSTDSVEISFGSATATSSQSSSSSSSITSSSSTSAVTSTTSTASSTAPPPVSTTTTTATSQSTTSTSTSSAQPSSSTTVSTTASSSTTVSPGFVGILAADLLVLASAFLAARRVRARPSRPSG